MKRRKDKTNFPNNVNKKRTNNKKVFLIGLIVVAAAISGILDMFMPSAAIRFALIGMCFAPLLHQSERNVMYYIQTGHRMLKAGPFPFGRVRSIIVTIILFSCCLTLYTHHAPLIIDNFHSKHQHQYPS
jgi:hypothetical protein